eukprot:3254818-Karenia_brevis.AAC.1
MVIEIAKKFGNDVDDTDPFSPPEAGEAASSKVSDDGTAGQSDPPVRERNAVQRRRLAARLGQ